MGLIGPGGKTEWPLPFSSAPRPTPLFRVVLIETNRRPKAPAAAGYRRVETEPEGSDLGEVLPQPAFDLGHGLALAGRVVLELVGADPADGEVARLRVREVETAHGRCGRHRERLGQVDPDRLRAQQAEELPLLAVVGARRIAERRPDAAEALRDELGRRELLVRRVPLAAHARMQPFGERLSKTVCERLDDDRAVVVVLAGVPCRELVRAVDRDGEGARVVALARDVVGQAAVRPPVAVHCLLPQEAEASAVDDDIVAV